MKKNLGDGDRAIRIILAGLLVIAYLLNVATGVAGTIALILAAILLITSFVGVCPLYRLFGINTCNIKKAH